MPVHGVDHNHQRPYNNNAGHNPTSHDHLPSFRQRSTTTSSSCSSVSPSPSPQLLPQTTYWDPRQNSQHSYQQPQQQQQQQHLSLNTANAAHQRVGLSTPSARDGASPDPRDYYLQFHNPFAHDDGSGPLVGDDNNNLTSNTASYAWRSRSPTAQRHHNRPPSNASPSSSRHPPHSRASSTTYGGESKDSEAPPTHSPEFTSSAFSRQGAWAQRRPPERQVSLLVDKFNQYQDQAPPRSSIPDSSSSSRRTSPNPYATSRPSATASRPQATRVSNPDRRGRDPNPVPAPPVPPFNSQPQSFSTADDDSSPNTPAASRKPLFGEIITSPDNNYLHPLVADGRGRSTARGRSGSDGSMHAPNPMFVDDIINPPMGLSPSSPTAWYLGYTPSLEKVNTSAPPSHLAHRRSRSDLGGRQTDINTATTMAPATTKMRVTTTNTSSNLTATANAAPGSQSPATPSSTTTPRPNSRAQSRIPVSSRRRMSHTSDSGSSSPSTTKPYSPWDRHVAGAPRPTKGASALPKPASQKSSMQQPSPTSPNGSIKSSLMAAGVSATTPTRQRGNTGNRTQNQAQQKSPSLNAYISAPPQKTSPPLRSSRPRQPVSSATTSASRAKVVERISSFNSRSNSQNNSPTSPTSAIPKPERNNNSNNNDRNNRQRARRIPELGNVDFAARRHQIQQAFNKSIRENAAKREERAVRRKQREQEKAETQAQLEREREQEAKKDDMQTPTTATAADEAETPVAQRRPALETSEQTATDPQASAQVSVSDSPEMGQDEFVTPKEGPSPRVSDSLGDGNGQTLDRGEVVAAAAAEKTDTSPAAGVTEVERSKEQTSLSADTGNETGRISAATDTTVFDTEPQSDIPKPSGTLTQPPAHGSMLSHIMQMRESSSSESSSDDDDEDEDDEDDDFGLARFSRPRDDKESIQIMLRRSGYYAPSMGTTTGSSENQEENEAAEGERDDTDFYSRCSEDHERPRNMRWSLSSWGSSAINAQEQRRPSQASSSLDVGDARSHEQHEGAGPESPDGNKVPTPQPLFATRYDPHSTKDTEPEVLPPTTHNPTQTLEQQQNHAQDAANGERGHMRVSSQLQQQYPDLVKQAKWNSGRATQLYLQQLKKAGFESSSRFSSENDHVVEQTVSKPEDHRHPEHVQSHDRERDDRSKTRSRAESLTDDAVFLPEPTNIPDSDYTRHSASLNLRDDWERASPSIADWMHLAAGDSPDDDKDVNEQLKRYAELPGDGAVPDREGAETPRMPMPNDLDGNNLAVDGLGLSIHVQAPQDGDSPTIPLPHSHPQLNAPPHPEHAPPPPPAEKSKDQSDISGFAHVQISPSIYSSHPPSTTLPASRFARPVEQDGGQGHRSSESSSLHHVGATPSPQTRASSATSQDRISGDQAKPDAEPITKTTSKDETEKPSLTEDQRRLKKRSNIIKELVDTEYTFGQDMTVVVDIYKGTSSSCLDLSPEDVKTLFANAEQIVQFSMDFQDTLKQAARSVYVLPKSQRWRSKRDSKSVKASNVSASGEDDDHQSHLQKEDGDDDNNEISEEQRDRETFVGKTFMACIERMEKVYTYYLKNHDAANKKLTALQKSKKVNIWLRECHDWAVDLTSAWNLDSLLVKPVQRILKYPLLLTELLSATPTDHPDHAAIADALRETTSISSRINEMKKRADVVGQVVSNRKRKESDVRAGLSKAFGRRTEKLKQHVGLTETFTDKDFDGMAQQFGENFFQLQLIMRDVELYTTEASNAVSKLNDFAAAIEAYIALAPSNYPEMESKWCRFRLAVKDVMAVALADHLASVRKSVINPIVSLLKLHDGPQRVMQKRNKRLLDYVKLKSAQSRGDKPDKKTKEQGEQFIALNDTLKDELPKLVTLTGRLMEACLNSFVHLQASWQSVMQKRLSFILDRTPDGMENIVNDWSGDFSFSEAQVLSLGICNGSALAETGNMNSFSSAPNEPKVSTSSSRPSTMHSAATRSNFSGAEPFSSPKLSQEMGMRSPNNFVQSPVSMNSPDVNQYQYQSQNQNQQQSTDRARASTSETRGRARTNSSFTGRVSAASEIPSMAAVMNQQNTSSRATSTSGSGTNNTVTQASTSQNHAHSHAHNHNYYNYNDYNHNSSRPSLNSVHASDASPSLPQLSLGTSQLHEFLADPALLANHRGEIPDPNDHPSSPARFSGFFSSAMPMDNNSTPPTPLEVARQRERGHPLILEQDAAKTSADNATDANAANGDTNDEEDEAKNKEFAKNIRNGRGELPVLFLAASMFDFNIDRARREAGFPYLTYVAGEVFDVVATKGDLWLARNQDDPTGQVGWIWTKHFAQIAVQDGASRRTP